MVIAMRSARDWGWFPCKKVRKCFLRGLGAVDNPLKTPGCRAGAALLHARSGPGVGHYTLQSAVVFCNFEIDV